MDKLNSTYSTSLALLWPILLIKNSQPRRRVRAKLPWSHVLYLLSFPFGHLSLCVFLHQLHIFTCWNLNAQMPMSIFKLIMKRGLKIHMKIFSDCWQFPIWLCYWEIQYFKYLILTKYLAQDTERLSSYVESKVSTYWNHVLKA